MPTQRTFATHDVSRGRDRACAWAAERASDLPHAVQYLAPQTVEKETLTAAWESHGSRLSLGVTRFDALVNEAYETTTHRGSETYVTAPERQYIVERALTRITDRTNPLFTEDEPATGLVEQAANLLTLLEFAGLDTPEKVRSRLDDVGVPSLAGPLGALFEYTYDIRDETVGQAKSFRAERYLHVIRNPETLTRTFPTTDVVIVGARRTLSPLERDLLGGLSTVFDIAVVLPRATGTDPPSGADATLSRAVGWYRELGFEDPDDKALQSGIASPDVSLASALYRYRRDRGEASPVPDNLHYWTAPSIGTEVESVVRQIRALLGDSTESHGDRPASTPVGRPGDEDIDPEDICIALYDEETYARPLVARLRAADIPVSETVSHQFFATRTGQLLDAALELGAHPHRQEPLCALLSNPLVRMAATDDLRTLTETAARMEATRLTALRSEVDEPLRSIIDTVVDACETFTESDTPGTAIDALFDTLCVPRADGATGLAEGAFDSAEIQHRESRALEQALTVGDALAGIGDQHTATALRRALDGTSVDTRVGRETGSVRLVTPMEAVVNPFEVVFLPGLNAEQTPSRSRRLAFARTLNEAAPEFAETDPVQQTRHSFALLLAGEASLSLSRPTTTQDGDPYVPADVLTELERVSDLSEPMETTPEAQTAPATRTDIHRSLARAVDSGGRTPDAVRAALNTFDIGVDDAHVHQRLDRGLAVATARATDEPGRFDGHVDESVVDQFTRAGSPFSPSALERYAACGFNYYMDSVLNFDEPDEISIEPGPPEVGGYVHAVLESFSRRWMARGHDAVTEETLPEAEKLLYETGITALDRLDAPETSFHRQELASLFDGLSSSRDGPGDPTAPPGLFRRFLEMELSLASTPARPVAFEGHVGLDPGDSGAPVLAESPVRLSGVDATIYGKIDRLDATPADELVAYDYKTGNTPSESDTIGGYRFQLPVYLLLAESALDGEPVGGSYYRVDASKPVSVHAGTIGSREDTDHHRYPDDELLRRAGYLEFESRGEFQAFLHEETTARIDRIASAVEAGSFHPTVLDPGDAGCEHCPYRQACDVRHHRRHDIRAHLDRPDTPPAYIPAGERPEGEQ